MNAPLPAGGLAILLALLSGQKLRNRGDEWWLTDSRRPIDRGLLLTLSAAGFLDLVSRRITRAGEEVCCRLIRDAQATPLDDAVGPSRLASVQPTTPELAVRRLVSFRRRRLTPPDPSA